MQQLKICLSPHFSLSHDYIVTCAIGDQYKSIFLFNWINFDTCFSAVCFQKYLQYLQTKHVLRLTDIAVIMLKGQGEHEAISAPDPLKTWSFLIHAFYIHIIKAIRHSYQDYVQTSVCLFYCCHGDTKKKGETATGKEVAKLWSLGYVEPTSDAWQWSSIGTKYLNDWTCLTWPSGIFERLNLGLYLS